MLCEKFLERLKNIIGDEETRRYLDSFEKSPSRALRFNPLKSTLSHEENFAPYLTQKLDFKDGAYLFELDRIGTHPYHHAGIFYIQEPSAMVPVTAVKITPDMKILDTCASPGGKSTQAAENLSGGFLVSNEIVPSRAKTLSGNVERLGFTNVTVTNTDTKTLSEIFPDFFDLVIADAPCSGEGMFRKDSGAIDEWSEDNVLMCAERQREILDNVARCVKVSGKLLYSTCTFSLEENENNVEWFLESHPDFRLCEPSEKSRLASTEGKISNTRRLYPHTSSGEGQFFALFERVSGAKGDFSKKSALTPLPDSDLKIIREFLEKYLISIPEGKICQFKENAVLVPNDLPVPEKITYSCGVTLGRVEKKVFRPHHHLFSALGHLFRNKIDLTATSPEIEKYLHGETFNTTSPDGWACVTVDCAPLGGVKITGGVAKNHYPKGLRNM